MLHWRQLHQKMRSYASFGALCYSFCHNCALVSEALPLGGFMCINSNLVSL